MHPPNMEPHVTTQDTQPTEVPNINMFTPRISRRTRHRATASRQRRLSTIAARLQALRIQAADLPPGPPYSHFLPRHPQPARPLPALGSDTWARRTAADRLLEGIVQQHRKKGLGNPRPEAGRSIGKPSTDIQAASTTAWPHLGPGLARLNEQRYWRPARPPRHKIRSSVVLARHARRLDRLIPPTPSGSCLRPRVGRPTLSFVKREDLIVGISSALGEADFDN